MSSRAEALLRYPATTGTCDRGRRRMTPSAMTLRAMELGALGLANTVTRATLMF